MKNAYKVLIVRKNDIEDTLNKYDEYNLVSICPESAMTLAHYILVLKYND